MKLSEVKKYVKYKRNDGNVEIVDTQVDLENIFGSMYMKDENGNLYWGKFNYGKVEVWTEQGTIIEESEILND